MAHLISVLEQNAQRRYLIKEVPVLILGYMLCVECEHAVDMLQVATRQEMTADHVPNMWALTPLLKPKSTNSTQELGCHGITDLFTQKWHSNLEVHVIKGH